MSGHSKWNTIKHKKAKEDAKRGKVFSKLIREITIAARHGGGDPASNARLRAAITTARAANMPADNIERAIKKGTGDLPGSSFDEVTYEIYGPGGVAIIVDILTDNKNRTTAELRHILDKNNAHLAEVGSVLWNFDKKGLIMIETGDASEDDLVEVGIESGAEDVRTEDDVFEVLTDVRDFSEVKDALDRKGIRALSAEITLIPKSTVPVEGKQAEQVLKLMDALEDHDDVQHVYSNFDMPDTIMAQAEKD